MYQVKISPTNEAGNSKAAVTVLRQNSRQVTKIGDENVQRLTYRVASVHRLF